MKHGLSYCGQLVKAHDPDRFLCSMFAPANRREAVWALCAFNHEIAKTREVVSETQLGLIRLQWWRDTIAKIYDPPASCDYGATSDVENPILRALTGAIQAYDLPQDLFETLIYAREFDLEDVLPGTMEGFLHYADLTSTPLLQLIMQVIDPENDDPVQAVATNYALAGILRSVLPFARQRRCLLPQDRMQSYDVKLNQLYDPPSPKATARQEFYTQLADVVHEAAEGFVPGISCENRYLRAVQKVSELYMRQLEQCGYDIFHSRLQFSPSFKELRVFLNL